MIELEGSKLDGRDAESGPVWNKPEVPVTFLTTPGPENRFFLRPTPRKRKSPPMRRFRFGPAPVFSSPLDSPCFQGLGLSLGLGGNLWNQHWKGLGGGGHGF